MTKKKHHFSWSDIFAFCFAMYRILLPQLIIALLIVLAVILFLTRVWFAP